MRKRLRYLRAAINTLNQPGVIRAGVYYFGKCWDTEIQKRLLDQKELEWAKRQRRGSGLKARG